MWNIRPHCDWWMFLIWIEIHAYTEFKIQPANSCCVLISDNLLTYQIPKSAPIFPNISSLSIFDVHIYCNQLCISVCVNTWSNWLVNYLCCVIKKMIVTTHNYLFEMNLFFYFPEQKVIFYHPTNNLLNNFMHTLDNLGKPANLFYHKFHKGKKRSTCPSTRPGRP